MSGMPFKRDWALSHTRAQRLVRAQLNFGLTEEERYAELYNRATVA